jgi:glyoxylase-like metal-dependent hydrolase (beta-lactamase superfamily II)
VICDLGNGSLTSVSAAAREAEGQGATEIAVLMLTHYHTRTAGTLTDILARETVRSLWLPKPQTTDDYYLLLSCLEKAEAANTPAYLYGEGEVLTLFGGCEAVLETDSMERSVQPVLLLSLDMGGGGRTVYCGSAVFESDLAETASAWVADADTVIFGNHGPLPKAPFGEGLTLREDATVILSAEGDVAGWLSPEAARGWRLWYGQWRGRMRLTDGGERS